MRPPSKQPLAVAMLTSVRERRAGSRRAPSWAVLRDMWFAALQRALGARWELIEAALGRQPGTCQGWRVRYPWYWDYLYRAAENYALEVAAEAAGGVLARLPPSKPRGSRGKGKSAGG